MGNPVKQYLKKYPNQYSSLQKIYYNMILLPKSKIKNRLISVLTQLYVWIPIQKNKIVICYFSGKGFGGNPKYIADEILRQNHKYELVWLLEKELIGKTQIPEQIRIVRYGSLRSLYELATAKIWLDNDRKLFSPPKRKKQYYLQIMHGIASLKQVEKDAEKQQSNYYIEKAKKDSRMVDLFITNSTFCTNLLRRAYWYDGPILEVGAPRCEILINKNGDIDKKIRNYFNIDDKKHILLYAPTWRDAKNIKVYDVDFESLNNSLEKKYGGKWVILVRLHPMVSSKSNSIEYNSNVLNATDYDDMNELLSVSDILITDYSSCMFEFSITKKPIFLYVPDIEEYTEERNFYFDLLSLPYPLARDNFQLLNVLEKFDKDKYLLDLNEFYKNLGVFDPKGASAQIVEVINKMVYQDFKSISKINTYSDKSILKN